MERQLASIKEVLRTTEAQFLSVVEGSQQGIIIQQDGRIVYANAAMARLFDYPCAADMIGLDPFSGLIGEADLASFHERTAAAYAGEHLSPHPGWRARRRDGKTVWISSTASQSQWQGRTAVTSFYLDITESKAAQIALQQSETRYRSALTAGRMGSWETDFVTGVRTWTEEGMQLFGLALEGGRGIVGGPDDEFYCALHPDDRHLIQEIYEQSHTIDSFPAEYRIVKPDGAIYWLSGRGQIVDRLPDGRAHRLISIMTDITERKAAELHVQFLLKEMTHRSKNLLAVVQSISRQTGKTVETMPDFQNRFASRLQGLAASHDVLIREGWRGARLGELIRMQLVPFADLQSGRVAVEGPPVNLAAPDAQSIGLAIHELATNAVKYGALSTNSGTVRIGWDVRGEGAEKTLQLTWAETGGPKVAPPERKGFGLIMLDQLIAAALNGEVNMSFSPTGVLWTVAFPEKRIEATDAGSTGFTPVV
jgi:PAS domain S-box-containing protein